MKIGIGIDTGGTYTDAVLYDFESDSILAKAKSLTTKEDLSFGIGTALDALPLDLIAQADFVSLSTTLATNACVEEKGARAKLLFIGLEERIIRQVGESYGLHLSDDLHFLTSDISAQGEIISPPDWEAFRTTVRERFADCDAVGIVALHAVHNNAVQEKQAARIVREEMDIPVICGHELFSDINCVQRGASILLNAHLVPVIADFLHAIQKAFRKRNIHAPAVIVRSDGTLMSEAATWLRPVETLLCGPAASVIGGMHLADEANAVIVDMGGTTTDIALVQNSCPVQVKDGIRIGKWKTFVKGLFIDTFGLGGDSAVRYRDGELYLDTVRVVPLCIAAGQYPCVTDKLQRLADSGKTHTLFLHEFFMPVRDIGSNPNYDRNEKAFCEKLKAGPLLLDEAAAAMGRDIYSFRADRLEREGAVVRCGLTPTDIMHLKGDFTQYSTAASALGAAYVAACLGCTTEELCEKVYFLVKQKLYTNIVRVLLQNRYPCREKDSLSPDTEMLIRESFTRDDSACVSIGFKTPSALIGIGAPVHIFLPDVARALGTHCVISDHAGVANALGAIVGNVSATSTIEVKPEYLQDGTMLFTVFGKLENRVFADQNEAEKYALSEAKQYAETEARGRGAVHGIHVSGKVETNTARTPLGSIYLGSRATATAIGRITG